MSLSEWKKHTLDKGKNPASDKGFLCPSPLPPHLTHETGSPCIDKKKNWSSEFKSIAGKTGENTRIYIILCRFLFGW
jgi:hypothetical protein